MPFIERVTGSIAPTKLKLMFGRGEKVATNESQAMCRVGSEDESCAFKSAKQIVCKGKTLHCP